MMNLHDTQSSAKKTAKRSLFAKPLVIAASLALSAVALPAAAASWWDATPNISIGSRTVNVKNFGARGNGTHNDTAAIQSAIDSLPSSGGTVFVPAGRYMIDATKALKLHSHTRLKLDPDAELRVIPNGASRYWVVKVHNANNVEIVGGKMTGDRARHKGTRGEWGYGINISGSDHVLVRNVHLSEFWGDGMWIGALGRNGSLDRSNYVTLNNVTSSHNRRQGLSIGPAKHVYIVNSTFKDTKGTLPEAGIDFEPQEQGPADTIRLENNLISGNNGNGIEMHAHVSNVTFKGNTFIGNRGFGLMSINAHHMKIHGNYATKNGLAGLRMSAKTHNVTIRNNKLQYNSTHYMSPTSGGGADNRDIKIGKKTYSNTISDNQLTPNR